MGCHRMERVKGHLDAEMNQCPSIHEDVWLCSAQLAEFKRTAVNKRKASGTILDCFNEYNRVELTNNWDFFLKWGNCW